MASANIQEDPKFHVENDTIITTKDEITVQEVFNYLSKNLDKFRVGSQFTIICGVHGYPDGKLGEGDLDLVSDYHAMLEWFHNSVKYPQQAKVVKERQYLMGNPLTIFSKKDKNQKDKYVLQNHSRVALKIKFEEMLYKCKPIVLILASCWSHKSEISNILRSVGIFTVMNVLEERGKITNGNMFQLDPEQREFLNKVANLDFNDIILMGMNILFNF